MELTRLFRWERYEPNIGNNRQLEPAGRFYVDLAVGLAKAQLADLAAKYDAALKEKISSVPMAEAYGPFVRMGSEPLVYEGKPVATLAEYLALCEVPENACNLVELPRALLEANSVAGNSELFFERLSGGFTSTAASSNAPAGSQGAAR